jgi:nanoRNase/pAp phosphatase (c-di-AMP/oligoRNAs hydrolase)
MRAIEQALGDRTVAQGFCVASVGPLDLADRDAVPQAAEFLIREETVVTALVFALLRDGDGRETVAGSLRSLDAAFPVGRFFRQALGTDAEGRPYGGGRIRAGGFEVDASFGRGDGDARDRIDWPALQRDLRRRFLRAAGVDDGMRDG